MTRPGARSPVWVMAAAAIAACDSPATPRDCLTPAVIASQIARNPNNVLSAVVYAYVSDADSVALSYGRLGTLDSKTPAFPSTGGEITLPLLGLEHMSQYDVRVVAFNSCGSTKGAMHTFVTDPLPSDLPRYRTSGDDPSPGYLAFAAGTYGIVIDNSGKVVWYHRFPNGPGLNFQPQPNGRYAARPNSGSAADQSRWIEIDVLGNVTRRVGCAKGYQARMHDALMKPDGSYWLLCDEVRTIDLSLAGLWSGARVTGTTVQHISASGELLFEWSPFDGIDLDLRSLEPADMAGGMINWTHGNSFDLDSDGNLLVSFRNLNQVIKVDTRTGAVVWRMGGPGNQFTFAGLQDTPFRRQHSVRAVGSGQLQLLDNLGEESGSRVERYELDEVNKVARLQSSHVASTGTVALTGGTVQGLSGGRTLVTFGSGGTVEEVNSAGVVTWRIDGNPGYVFRVQRIQSLYSPGVGDPR